MSNSNVPEYGSDVVVDMLVDMGVKILPFAPGATFRGIHDSLVNYREDAPEVIECLHEEISVAVAHGYAKASGEIGVAALHDVVGLQHATMAIYNAWCDQVPLLLLGGTGPVDAAKRRPWIDWIHTANVQATQVRDYTKWDDQPASLEAMPESLVRGQQLALSSPSGPVYICLDSEIQEQRVSGQEVSLQVSEYPSARALYPDPAAVEQIGQALIDADFPLIAVESINRSQRAMDLLTELSDISGSAVTEVQRDYNRTALCLPTTHPHNVTGIDLPVAPDMILALEVRDVAVIPSAGTAPVYQVSTAGLNVKAWAADLQRVQAAKVLVPADVLALLEALVPIVAEKLSTDFVAQERVRARKSALESRVTQQREEWLEQAQTGDGGDAVTVPVLARRLDLATQGYDRILANGSLHNWVHRLWDIDRVDSYLGSSGGAGLGYGLGASIGAALAHRASGRLVIDIQSDGDALMTPGAFWTAAKHRVPLLIVMENNRQWGNSFMHAERIADIRGRSREKAGVGTTIVDPEVDFVKLAKSMGISDAWRVDTTSEIDSILRKAIDVVTFEGRPALVDVRTG